MYNTVAVANFKGGVLKSSLSASLAGLAAAAGWNTLLVDADPQGDAQVGYGYGDRSDGGDSLAGAVERGGVATPITGIRPNLDVIAGGPELHRVQAALSADALSGRQWHRRLEAAIAPVAANYDIVIIDTAPTSNLLTRSAYAISRGIITVTQPDLASLHGLAEVLATVVEMRATGMNPMIEVLGVVCGPVLSTATAQARELKETINSLLETDTLLVEPFIRSAPAAAELCRREGLLPHELEAAQDAADRAEPFYKQLREGKRSGRRRSSAIGGLAEDYRQVCEELLRRYVDMRARDDAALERHDTTQTSETALPGAVNSEVTS